MACIDCKNYVPSTTRPTVERGNGFLCFGSEPVPAYCSKGFDQVFALWWKENGMRPGAEARLDVCECFEKSESTIALEGMVTLVDRMQKILKS